MEENKKIISNAKKITSDVNKCEKEIIDIINSYNFNPTISRLIIVEILRFCEATERNFLNQGD